MAETKANSLAFLLQRFRNAQDRRPIIYKQFDGNQKADDHFSAFKSLISDDDDEHHHHHHGHSQRLPKKIAAFQQQTAAITQEFQAVSLEIRAVEAELNELGQTTIAALIRELQLLEKSNLMTTTKLQQLQQTHADLKATYVEYEEAQYEESYKEISAQLAETRAQINEKLDDIRVAEQEAQ